MLAGPGTSEHLLGVELGLGAPSAPGAGWELGLGAASPGQRLRGSTEAASLSGSSGLRQRGRLLEDGRAGQVKTLGPQMG